MAENACRSYCLMNLRIYRSACCTELPMLVDRAELQTKMLFYCSDASLLSLASPQVEHSTTTGRAAHSVDIRGEYAILVKLTHWRIVVDDDFYLLHEMGVASHDVSCDQDLCLALAELGGLVVPQAVPHSRPCNAAWHAQFCHLHATSFCNCRTVSLARAKITYRWF